jgi:hypothetical protein
VKNRNYYIYKKPTIKLSMGMLALGSLLAIAGCNNSLVDNQLIKAAAEKPVVSKTENPSTQRLIRTISLLTTLLQRLKVSSKSLMPTINSLLICISR